MSQTPKLIASLVALVALVPGTLLLAEAPAIKKTAPAKFVRVQRDAQEQAAALETAIVRYVPASGEGDLVVDLVGVVHVGDRPYYEKLNKLMEQYDVLLYELVAPPGTRIPKGGRQQADNPIAMLQHLMKSVLKLESQTEHIDYTRKNFVHADLSPDQMAEAIRNRGEDGFTLFLKVAADLMQQQNLQEMRRRANPLLKEEADLDLLTLFLDPEGSLKLKRMLAGQLEAMGGEDAGLGKTLTTILVTDRNQAALKVFQKELAKGRKKIGIFYGAAHMPDFEKRLRDEFGLKKQSEQWLTAWDLRPKKKGVEGLLFDLLKDLER
jgi:hypothetical protein